MEALKDAAQPTAVRFVGTIADIENAAALQSDLRPLGPDDPCYIQYSSGSTNFPRGVLVSQEALVANARAISEDGLALTADDRCVSWLPLYHDMGLVGCCLTPVMNQVSVDYLATSSFARRPLVWLKLMSENRATISFSPTFGYELCARRASTQKHLCHHLVCQFQTHHTFPPQRPRKAPTNPRAGPTPDWQTIALRQLLSVTQAPADPKDFPCTHPQPG